MRSPISKRVLDRFCLIAVASAGLVPIVALANVTGTDAQNFNPTTSGLDFVTVHSSETLKPGVINVGLFLNYAVNTLPYFENSPQGRLNFNDSILGLDLNAGIGLTSNWDVGFSLPQVLNQTVEDQNGARGEFSQAGATEVRFNTKYRLLGDDTGGLAVIGSVNLNRIENNPYVGRGAGPTTNVELAADTTAGKVALGANFGYRFRQPGDPVTGSVIAPLQDQIIASLAASYHSARWNTKFIGEVFGSLPAKESNSDGERNLSSLELLLGAKHDITTNLAFHAGLGSGLSQGIASPDWRIYTGVNYAFGPVFRSEDAPIYHHLVRIQDPLDATTPRERYRTQNIQFEFDSDQMSGDYSDVLAELAERLKDGFNSLVIEGHTDSIGPEAYNQKLSLRRAAAIKSYLVKRYGLDGSRIRTIGYGESRPIADNGNFQGRQQNRRVEFELVR